MKVNVGLCGFSMSMRNYARHFPVVEIQQTFYEPPRDAIMKKWRAETGAMLEYTMKVWQLVTHAANSPTYRRMKRTLKPNDVPGGFRDTRCVQEGWQRSVECADVLGATGMLFQCPASYDPSSDNVQHLRRFFNCIRRPHARLLWEPRGNGWIERRDLAVTLCEELDLTLVVDPFVTKPWRARTNYWRLHGPGSAHQPYSDQHLQSLKTLLLGGVQQNPETTYVMFNNIPRILDANRLSKLLTI